MNFKTIVVDIEQIFKGSGTDVEKFANAFWTLFKKPPQVTQIVLNFVTEAAPVLIIATSLVDPLIEPEVAGALAIVETGLAGIQASLTAASTGKSLLANLENFATTVPTLLSGLAIKNPELQANIVKIVNLVVNESKVIIPAVQAWVSKLATTKAAIPTV